MTHCGIAIALLPCAVLLAGCNADTRIEALEEKLAALEAANKALETKVEDLEFRVQIGGWDQVAFLRPGDDGYAAVKYDLGVLTVQITDVKSYANGSKVALKFGNLTSARVDGVKAKLEWGKVNEKGLPQNESAKSREVTFGEALLPGSWTVSELVLEGVPPTELGFVRLREVSHRGIGLRR